MAMWKIDIHDEVYFIKCKEDFVQLVERFMGLDATDWLKDFIQEGTDYQEERRIQEAFEEMKDDITEKMESTLETIKEEISTAKKDCLSAMWA